MATPKCRDVRKMEGVAKYEASSHEPTPKENQAEMGFWVTGMNETTDLSRGSFSIGLKKGGETTARVSWLWRGGKSIW